ncbi:MAG: bile acid:sodium symporter family protein [Kofleriaceae bacterium]
MLAAGMGFTVRDIISPLRDPGRVARALVGNFVLVPLLAVGVVHAFSLDPALELGLILLGTSAGTPFLIKLVAFARADVALGTALLVLLVPMTVVFMPIAVPLLAPDIAVDAAAIAVPLALTLLLPLGVGLIVSEKAQRWARRLQPIARTASTITLVLLFAAILLVNLRDLGHLLASRAAFAILVFVAGSFVIGYVIASPHPERRAVLGLGTAQRNIAAATVVAAEGFRGSDTLVLVVVTAVVGLLFLVPLARWLRRWIRNAAAHAPHSELSGSRA